LFTKKTIILLIISIAVIISPSCQDHKPNKNRERPYGDTIIIGDIFEPDIINPILAISGVSSDLVEIVFDGLVTRDEDMEIRPNLALSWDISNNGLTWRFYLRKGVKFHDGKELTAQDVKFTYEKIKDPDIKGWFFNNFRIIKDIRVIDRYTIEITLNKPFYPLLNYLDVGILPRHILLKDDIKKSDFNYHPIGTGPYRLTGWSRKEIILDANKEYFKARPYINRIIIKIIRNQKTAWARLMSGEIDLFYRIYPKDYDIIRNIPSFNVYSFVKPYYYMLAFNLKSKIFNDLRIRQALNHAIDKDLIINEILCKEGIISSGTISHYSWAYNPSIRPYPFNPQKALNLLKQAGWSDTDGDKILDNGRDRFEFDLLLPAGDNLLERTSMFIQQQLIEIGIKMNVKVLPSILFDNYMFKKRFDSVILYLTAHGDPDMNYQFWHSSQIKDGFNVFSYKNNKIDEQLEKGRLEPDKEKRKEIYYCFQEEIFADPPGIFLFWSNFLVGVDKRFRGIKPSTSTPLKNVYKWYVPKEEQKYK